GMSMKRRVEEIGCAMEQGLAGKERWWRQEGRWGSPGGEKRKRRGGEGRGTRMRGIRFGRYQSRGERTEAKKAGSGGVGSSDSTMSWWGVRTSPWGVEEMKRALV
ncbi:hypothetical protein AMTR_s00096p00130880, partial [Amborella trichopoda]